MHRVKIVATIGPGTNNEPQLKALWSAGMDIARLNGSHPILHQHHRSTARGGHTEGFDRGHPALWILFPNVVNQCREMRLVKDAPLIAAVRSVDSKTHGHAGIQVFPHRRNSAPQFKVGRGVVRHPATGLGQKPEVPFTGARSLNSPVKSMYFRSSFPARATSR